MNLSSLLASETPLNNITKNCQINLTVGVKDVISLLSY